MSNYAALRLNMVESQVRANDVTDPAIHEALRQIPREQFVPAAQRALAYADVPVEVAPGRWLMDPRSIGKLLQLAEPRAHEKALVVGCATGYSAAVMARLTGHVVALEQDADLVRIATETLHAEGITNVQVVQGALVSGARAGAPFEVIFVDGAVEAAPEALLAQLAEGGRLVAVIRKGAGGRAHLFTRHAGRISSRGDFDSGIPALAGFRQPLGFVF